MRAFPSLVGIALVLVPTLWLTGCGDSTPQITSSSGKIASVRVTPTAASVVPGEPLQLEATPLDISNNPLEDLPVSWSTSDPEVAEVSADGSITAIHPGQASVTATIEGLSVASLITVDDGGFLGPSGGTLSALGGTISLVVPAGALDAPRAIRVEPVVFRDPDATLALAPFRIRLGVGFTQPATLNVTYDPALAPAGVPESDLGLRLVSLQGDRQSAAGTVDPSSHTATAAVTGTAIYDVGRIAPQTPCTAPEFRQFDFWLGQWNVTPTGSPPGTRPASSVITAEPGGCAVFEDFRDLGTHGVSINVYDPSTLSWYETFVDNNDTRLVIRGGLVGGDMLLTAPPGDSRITWSASGGTVRQLGEASEDGGQTWSPNFDLTYVAR